MRSVTLLPDSTPRPVLYWAPPAAALITAVFMAGWAYPALSIRSLSAGLLLAVAAKYVLTVFLASCAVAMAIYQILPRNNTTSRASILRVTACTVWFAPAAFFLLERSTWLLALSAVLGLSMIRRFRRYHLELSEEEPAIQEERQIFRVPDSPMLVVRMIPALCASVSLQAAALAGLISELMLGAVFSGIGIAIISWPRERKQQRTFANVAPALMLAILITAAGLTRYLDIRPGTGGFGSFLWALINGGTADAARQRQKSGNDARGEGEEEGGPIGAYSGVILWPEVQKHTVLVPPLPAMRHNLFAKNSADSLSIPFFGVYYLFKSQFRKPPRNSITARGSPAALSYRTTDRIPLSMEAHQNFGTLIDLSCCSRIQVAISNADRRPDTVALELILSNTSLPGHPSLSLGLAPVKSTLRWQPSDDRPPVSELLSFTIPASPSIRQFDEATVAFRLHRRRSDHSARIAVDRFVLIPRGR